MTDKPVAIVTGASRGIGKAIAIQLATLGYDLVINHFDFTPDGKPDNLHADETQQQINALNSTCHTLRGDISNPDDRLAILNLTKDKFSRCDLLVNNAGVAPQKRLDLLEATEESFDRVLRINLKGPYFLTQLIANWMIQQHDQHPSRPLRVINTSSLSAYTSSPGRGEYCVSKAGVSMMTMLYADRLAQHNIGVFEIRPGIIKTDMTSVVTDKYDKLIEDGLLPTQRWGLSEDVAKAAAAIAQGLLDYSTGQVINVDGGFHFRRL